MCTWIETDVRILKCDHGTHNRTSMQVRALWDVMDKTPGSAPQSTIQADNFVWLAEALTSKDPDCVVRPVKLPKISRAGRFKSLAKSIAPMKTLLSKKGAKSATSTSVPDNFGDKSPAKDADGLPPIAR